MSPVLAAGAHHAVHQVDDPRRADQGVLAGGGRGGAGVGILPRDHRVVPHLRLGAGDDADRLGFALQDRALFNMQLEIGIGRERARGFRAAIADRVQRRADGDAVRVLQGFHLGLGVHAGPDPGPHQAVAEAAAFFIGP